MSGPSWMHHSAKRALRVIPKSAQLCAAELVRSRLTCVHVFCFTCCKEALKMFLIKGQTLERTAVYSNGNNVQRF